MKKKIANNIFEFYSLVGSHSHFLTRTEFYDYVTPPNQTWPQKVFNVGEPDDNFKALSQSIKNNQIPNSVFISENKGLESQLVQSGFNLISTVTKMVLTLDEDNQPKDDFDTIQEVLTVEDAIQFARIASIAFSYEILPETIIALLNASGLKTFIGKQGNEFVSCGMLLIDRSGIPGLHMIGTLPEYRGAGLGKIMTNRLLLEAHKSESEYAVLAASEAGKRVYSKLGFKEAGRLRTYVLNV